VDTRAVFEHLGFTEDWEALTDQPPAYFYDFGNLLLSAAQFTISRSFRPAFLIGGVVRDARSLRQIDFEIPLSVDSLEQGVALIAHAVGKDFEPLLPSPWLSDGRQWQDHLPWLRDRAKYEARPKCRVERDWFRLARRKLCAIAEQCSGSELAWLAFDGEAVRFTIGEVVMIVPASGKAWPARYAIGANELRLLPKRLTDPVLIDIWDTTLGIGARRWQLRA
jgi:hypothetical protein